MKQRRKGDTEERDNSGYIRDSENLGTQAIETGMKGSECSDYFHSFVHSANLH